MKNFNQMRMRAACVLEPVARLSLWQTPRVVAAALLLPVAAAPPASAQQLPTGGSVAAGNVSIGAPQNGIPSRTSVSPVWPAKTIMTCSPVLRWFAAFSLEKNVWPKLNRACTTYFARGLKIWGTRLHL
jgi:hypothetical protein